MNEFTNGKNHESKKKIKLTKMCMNKSNHSVSEQVCNKPSFFTALKLTVLTKYGQKKKIKHIKKSKEISRTKILNSFMHGTTRFIQRSLK
jgi:hypothetical protein